MPDWDVELFSCFVEDVEAFWFFYVFEVYSAEGGFYELAGSDDFVGVFGVEAYWEGVYAAEVFEE